jgi:hypothetical protein
LVRRLDRVHGVLGPGHTGGDIVNTGSAAHFEDTVRAAESEACE